MAERLSTDCLSNYSLTALFDNPEKYRPYLEIKKFHAKEMLPYDLSAEQTLYVFVEGKFNVYGIQDNGDYVLFRNCISPMLIGENELIVRAHRDLQLIRKPTRIVEMVTDCTAISLHYRRILPDLLKDVTFLNAICHDLVEKTLTAGNMEIGAAFASAESKVANYLLTEAGTNELVKKNQHETAEQLRISYRHLHRILRKFVEDGLITREKGGYRIIDRNTLSEII